MEGLVINHQRNRFKGYLSKESLKEILYKNYNSSYLFGQKPDIRSLQLDHIIPFCISEDSSIENLQLLKLSEHKKKSGRDRKIINKFKKKGWIETITYYQIKLNKSKEFLIKEFKKELKNED